MNMDHSWHNRQQEKKMLIGFQKWYVVPINTQHNKTLNWVALVLLPLHTFVHIMFLLPTAGNYWGCGGLSLHNIHTKYQNWFSTDPAFKEQQVYLPELEPQFSAMVLKTTTHLHVILAPRNCYHTTINYAEWCHTAHTEDCDIILAFILNWSSVLLLYLVHNHGK